VISPPSPWNRSLRVSVPTNIANRSLDSVAKAYV
jgi:hypothetical protein